MAGLFLQSYFTLGWSPKVNLWEVLRAELLTDRTPYRLPPNQNSNYTKALKCQLVCSLCLQYLTIARWTNVTVVQ